MQKRLGLSLGLLLLASGCANVPFTLPHNVANGPPLERSVFQYMQDKSNQTKVLDALYSTDPRFNYARINPHVFMGVLLLTGQVQDDYLVKLAVDSVQKSEQSGISLIHNYLQQEEKPNAAQIAQDQYVLQVLQDSLYAIAGVSAKNTYIAVDKATVYVMGRVSQSSANAIVKAIEQTPGVRKIVMLVDIVVMLPTASTNAPAQGTSPKQPAVSNIPVASPATGVSLGTQPTIAAQTAATAVITPQPGAVQQPPQPFSPSTLLVQPATSYVPAPQLRSTPISADEPTNLPTANQLRIE